MRMVVDSNFLQTDDLRSYLRKSKQNFAVLTDYAAMEAYKRNTLKSIFPSMSVLGDFPDQVIVLRCTGPVCGLSGRTAGLQRRLIDFPQTRQFQKYCAHLKAAQRGDPEILRWLLRLGRDADEQMKRVEDGARDIPQTMKEISKEFSVSELEALRKSRALGEPLIRKLQSSICMTALSLFRQHPAYQKAPPPTAEARNTFLFRSSVAMHAWYLRWLRDGSRVDIPPEKVRNDVIDLNFVAYATFFDGILTNDKKLRQIHEETEAMLEFLFPG